MAALTLRVGSLFSGIGGFELGLERAGMEVAWSCDTEPFAQHILKKHWPDVPVYGDITTMKGPELEPVDVLCGGFPCQDISSAGYGAGIQEGTRSGLWSEYARLVGELRPRYVLVENVALLRRRGLDRVVGDLAALGYDAEWDCIRASDIGAPHRRDRLWLVAYVADPARDLSAWTSASGAFGERVGPGGESGVSQALADAHEERRDWRPRVFGPEGWTESADCRAELAAAWAVEPDVGRTAHGVPARVDRLRSLGNALVPQIAEWIGRRILAYEVAVQGRA